MSWFRNTITDLYNAVSAPVAVTHDALPERLQSVRDTASLLYNRTMHHIGETLKNIAGNAAKEEEGKRVKVFRITRTMNRDNTKIIMDKITQHIEMRRKVVYSFEAEIHRGAAEIVDYSKVLSSPPGMFTSLQEIREYIEECEEKRLDLENEEVWSNAYLPATRTKKVKGNYQGKVVFKHVPIKLIASNEPLLGCGPLPDWLRKKRCIYAVDGKNERNDILCVWRYLAICIRSDVKRGSEFVTKEALTLAREYYVNDKLKRQDVRATRLVDFKGIAKKFSIKIRVYEPKKNSEKAPWRLVYGQNQYKEKLDTINLGMFGGNCF